MLLPKSGAVNRAIAFSAGIAMLASCALLPGAPKPPDIGGQGATDFAPHQKRINEPLRIKYTSGVSKFNLQQVNVPEENYIDAQEVAYWPDGRVKTYRIKGWLNLGGERVWESNIGLWFWDTTVQDEGCKVDWCGDASFFANLNLPENVVSPRGTVRWGGCEIKDVRANINGISKSYVASTYSVWNNVYQGAYRWLKFATVDDGAQLFRGGVNSMNGWASTHCNSSFDVRWKCSYPGQPGQGCEVDVSWDTPADAPPTTDPGGGGSPSPGASPSDGSGTGGDPNSSPSPGSSGDPNGTPGPGGSGDPNGTPAPGGSGDPSGSPSPGSGSPSPSPKGSDSPGSGGAGGDGSGGDGSGGDGSGGTGGSGGGGTPSPSFGPTSVPSVAPTQQPTSTPQPTHTPTPIPLTIEAGESFFPGTSGTSLKITADPERGQWTIRAVQPFDGDGPSIEGIIHKGIGSNEVSWEGTVDVDSPHISDLLEGEYELEVSYDAERQSKNSDISNAYGLRPIGNGNSPASTGYSLFGDDSHAPPGLRPKYVARPPSANGRTFVINEGKILQSATKPIDKYGLTNAGSHLQSHSSPTRSDFKVFPDAQVGSMKAKSDLAEGLLRNILENPARKFVLRPGSLYIKRYGEEIIEVYAKVFVKNNWISQNVMLGVRFGARTNEFKGFIRDSNQAVPK